MDRLTQRDIHDARLAAHAKQYLREQMSDRGRGQRSTTNSREYQDWQQEMEARYGNR